MEPRARRAIRALSRTTAAVALAITFASTTRTSAQSRPDSSAPPGVGAPHSQTPVATVDLTRAVRETSTGRRATAELRAMFDARQASLDRQQASLRSERAQLDSALASGMARAEYDRRVADFTRRLAELQRTYQDFQAELNRRETQLTEQIRRGVEAAARRLASTRRISVIVDAGAVVARGDLVPPPPDVTDDVVREYEAQIAPTAAAH